MSATWTPLNALILPSMVSNRVPDGLSGSSIGLLTGVGIALAVIVQPIAGALSDRSRMRDRRRRTIVVAGLLMAAIVPLIVIVPGFWLLLAVYLALQCASNFAQASFQALIPDRIPAGERTPAATVKTALDVSGNAVGLVLVGAAFALGGGNTAALLGLAALIVTGVALFRIVTEPDPVPKGRTDIGGSVRAIVKSAWEPLFRGPDAFRLVVLLRFVFLLGLYPIQRFLLDFLKDRFSIEDPVRSASWALLAAIVLAAAGAAGAGFLASRISRAILLRATICISAAGVLGVALLPEVWMVGAAGILLAIGAGAFQGLSGGLLNDALEDNDAARYLGAANIATAGASAFAGLLGPVVDGVRHFFPGGTYQVTFSVAALVTLATLWPAAKVEAGRGDAARNPKRARAHRPARV